MMLVAVDKVVSDDHLMQLFSLNKNLWPAIRHSWKEKQLDFQGRFDFIYDGLNPPVMLEFNGDTPSLLLESGAIQQDWFNEVNGLRDDLY